MPSPEIYITKCFKCLHIDSRYGYMYNEYPCTQCNSRDVAFFTSMYNAKRYNPKTRKYDY